MAAVISYQVSPQDIYAEDEEVFRKRGAEKRQQPESRQRGYQQQQQQRQEEQPRYRDSSEGQGRRRFVDMEKEAVSAIYVLIIFVPNLLSFSPNVTIFDLGSFR